MSANDDQVGGESDVFAGLPRTRPQRPSARRAQTKKKPAVAATATAGKQPKAKAGPAKKAPAAGPSVAKKPKAPPIPRSGYATPEPSATPVGVDVVGAAVTAVTELARSVLGRLPKL